MKEVLEKLEILSKNQAILLENMAKVISNIGDLKKGQEEIKAEQKEMKQEQSTMKQDIVDLKKEQKRMNDVLTIIETEHGRKIDLIFDMLVMNDEEHAKFKRIYSK